LPPYKRKLKRGVRQRGGKPRSEKPEGRKSLTVEFGRVRSQKRKKTKRSTKRRGTVCPAEGERASLNTRVN